MKNIKSNFVLKYVYQAKVLHMLASFALHVLTFEFWVYYILFIFDFKMDTPR